MKYRILIERKGIILYVGEELYKYSCFRSHPKFFIYYIVCMLCWIMK